MKEPYLVGLSVVARVWKMVGQKAGNLVALKAAPSVESMVLRMVAWMDGC